MSLIPVSTKKVEHPQSEFGIRGDLFFVKFHDLRGADPQAGGIKLEVGLLFRGNADSDRAGSVYVFAVIGQLLGIVAHRDHIGEPVVDQLHDLLLIDFRLEPIANNNNVFIDFAFFMQLPDEVDIKSGTGLQLNLMA